MPRTPDSAIRHDVAGQSGRDPGEARAVDLERLEVAGVDADHVRTGGERAVGLLLGVHLHQRGHPERLGAVEQRAERGLVEGGDDQQHDSAPCARASWIWYGPTMKSLRSTGILTALADASRSASDPPKRRCSVSTLMTRAPPAS